MPKLILEHLIQRFYCQKKTFNDIRTTILENRYSMDAYLILLLYQENNNSDTILPVSDTYLTLLQTILPAESYVAKYPTADFFLAIIPNSDPKEINLIIDNITQKTKDELEFIVSIIGAPQQIDSHIEISNSDTISNNIEFPIPP